VSVKFGGPFDVLQMWDSQYLCYVFLQFDGPIRSIWGLRYISLHFRSHIATYYMLGVRLGVFTMVVAAGLGWRQQWCTKVGQIVAPLITLGWRMVSMMVVAARGTNGDDYSCKIIMFM
jgi:hypothetical protein